MGTNQKFIDRLRKQKTKLGNVMQSVHVLYSCVLWFARVFQSLRVGD